MTVPDQMREAVGRIESALSDFTGGGDNPKAKQTITYEINRLAGVTAVDQAKIRSLRGWVEILFIAGKHARYGGLATVKANLRADCASIRLAADQIEAAGGR